VPGPRRPHARPPGLWRPGRKFHPQSPLIQKFDN
jgi:hypothetical protein